MATDGDLAFTVRVAPLADFRTPGMQSPGTLQALQRLQIEDASNVRAHMHTYGHGLIRDILTAATDYEVTDIHGRRADLLPVASESLPRISNREWVLLIEGHPALVEFHQWRVKEIQRLADRLIKITDGTWLSSDRMPVTLQLLRNTVHELPHLSIDHRGDHPMDPYERARLECMLAAGSDGPGLARCDFCSRLFIQVRSGKRYSRFCPGFSCSQDYKVAEYEKSDYRREYRRRQASLSRLRARPATSAAEVRKAEREFDSWKTEQKKERSK